MKGENRNRKVLKERDMFYFWTKKKYCSVRIPWLKRLKNMLKVLMSSQFDVCMDLGLLNDGLEMRL